MSNARKNKPISNASSRRKGKISKRRLELLTSEAIVAMAIVIFGSFFLSGVARYLIGLPQTAAVVSSILVDLANGDRAANDLSALRVDPTLVAAAQAKANDMASKGYFAHVSPEGKDPWYWFQQAGYKFEYAGENLAVDFSDSADVERAWMHSPAHRANILDPHYTQIGIATAAGMYEGRPSVFVVQEFGTPSSASQTASERQTIATSTVPSTPTMIATAQRSAPAQKKATASQGKVQRKEVSGSQVLGSRTEAGAPSGPQMTVSASSKAAQSSAFGVAASSPIFYAISAPHDTLRSIYIVLALFLLAALAYTTRFEMKRHHLRHVGAVTGLVFLMGALFAVSSYYVFSSPQIPIESAATIAAGVR